MKAMKVPMCLPDITKKEVDVVSKVLLGSWIYSITKDKVVYYVWNMRTN